MPLFYGRLPSANRFIAGAALLSLRIFSSCDRLRSHCVRAARQLFPAQFLGRDLATRNRATIQWCDRSIISAYGSENLT